MEPGPDVLVVIPAFNEAPSVSATVHEVLAAAPKVHVLVVDDGSDDQTSAQARAAGSLVAVNPFNMGVGGAMRVGFRYAVSRGYRALVQVDADGQHDPRDLVKLLEPIEARPEPQVVIGARFAGTGAYRVPAARRWAMRLLAAYLSRMTHVRLTDVTSGYRAHNRAAMDLFARTYPANYLADTVESLVIAHDAGGRISQVPVAMRERNSGTPSQSTVKASVYLVQVALTLVVSILRRRTSRPVATSTAPDPAAAAAERPPPDPAAAAADTASTDPDKEPS